MWLQPGLFFAPTVPAALFAVVVLVVVARGGNFFRRGGERADIFWKLLVKGSGGRVPILGRGEKRNGVKLNKTESFDHFLDMYGRALRD
jgi:hypothetical protein